MAKKKKKTASKKKKAAQKKSRAKASKKKGKSKSSIKAGTGDSSDFLDRLSKQARESKARRGTGGGDLWRAQDGKSVIRVFTFITEGGEEMLFVEQLTHFNVIPGNPKTPVPCPRVFDEECAICKLKGELSSKQWDKVKASRAFLYNAVVRSARGEDSQVVAQLKATVHDEIQDFVSSEDPDIRIKNFLHPSKGRDIKIMRSGKGFDTEYKVVPSRKPSAIGMDVTPSDLTKFAKRSEHNLEELAEGLL